MPLFNALGMKAVLDHTAISRQLLEKSETLFCLWYLDTTVATLGDKVDHVTIYNILSHRHNILF